MPAVVATFITNCGAAVDVFSVESTMLRRAPARGLPVGVLLVLCDVVPSGTVWSTGCDVV